jgi:hypothetical protein
MNDVTHYVNGRVFVVHELAVAPDPVVIVRPFHLSPAVQCDEQSYLLDGVESYR